MCLHRKYFCAAKEKGKVKFEPKIREEALLWAVKHFVYLDSAHKQVQWMHFELKIKINSIENEEKCA